MKERFFKSYTQKKWGSKGTRLMEKDSVYGRVVLKDSRRKEESRVTRVASKKGEWDYD